MEPVRSGKRETMLVPAMIAAALMWSAPARADTITLKNNRVIKGVIVEDYHDRVIISTHEGEQFFKKSDILRVFYGTDEQNFLKLAKMSVDRGRYQEAYAYYDRALRANPKSKEARSGKVYVQNFIYKSKEKKKLFDIRRRSSFEEFGDPLAGEGRSGEGSEDLKKNIGLELIMAETNPQVIEVVNDSPAHKANIQEGDYIISIWGRLTGYMSMKQVTDILLEKSTNERAITIERNALVKIDKERGFLANIDNLIGASFSMELDGLTVSAVKMRGPAERAGVKKGDLIVAIDGASTRYMPLKIAVEMIHESKRDTVELTLRRNVNIWENFSRLGELL